MCTRCSSVNRPPLPCARAALQLVASAGGIGFLPRGPATVASYASGLALYRLSPRPTTHIGLIGGVVAVGQFASVRLTDDSTRDPQYIVLDEVAGVWLSVVGLPLTVATCAAGATIFRLLDKVKPPPIRAVDRSASRWSVMGDDLVAAGLTNVILRAARGILGQLG
jgi:phosphatidylglycerophosphatase A